MGHTGLWAHRPLTRTCHRGKITRESRRSDGTKEMRPGTDGCKHMWDQLRHFAKQLLVEWRFFWQRRPRPREDLIPIPESGVAYRPLQKLILTDGVGRTLFEEYARHRHDVRGEEETGWILMGLRLPDAGVALATLPAGAKREAGVAHVQFNSTAQAVACRILRQEDRRLVPVGIVHTHPGSLRHPSSGDYRGDKRWVKHLRGQEAAFGIGTADGEDDLINPQVASQPKEHCQCYMGFRFSWYALGADDRAYRPLPASMTIGPDLALPLHDVWGTIEAHAERLDRLCRQLARLRLEVIGEEKGHVLQLVVPLGDECSVRAILRGPDAEYFLVRKEQWLRSDNQEAHVDRGIFLMLAALAEGNI